MNKCRLWSRMENTTWKNENRQRSWRDEGHIKGNNKIIAAISKCILICNSFAFIYIFGGFLFKIMLPMAEEFHCLITFVFLIVKLYSSIHYINNSVWIFIFYLKFVIVSLKR